MEKITCIQNYVIDKLIEDEKLSSNSLLDAISKVCSKEQFDDILSVLIDTPIPCESSQSNANLVRMGMFVPKEASGSTKIEIIKILKNQFNFDLKQAKEYVDSCIGKYNILPKAVIQEEIIEVAEKLKPYSVIVSIAEFYQ